MAAASSSRQSSNMNPEVFELFRDRFDNIEKQNNEQLQLLRKHIEEDNKTHKVVERHTIYFQIFTLGIPVAIAYISKKLGLTN